MHLVPYVSDVRLVLHCTNLLVHRYISTPPVSPVLRPYIYEPTNKLTNITHLLTNIHTISYASNPHTTTHNATDNTLRAPPDKSVHTDRLADRKPAPIILVVTTFTVRSGGARGRSTVTRRCTTTISQEEDILVHGADERDSF